MCEIAHKNMCIYPVFAFKTHVFSSIIICFLLKTGVRKQHICRFKKACIAQSSNFGSGKWGKNDGRFTGDLRMGYGWVTESLRERSKRLHEKYCKLKGGL